MMAQDAGEPRVVAVGSTGRRTVLAVAHDVFREAEAGALRSYGRDGAVFCDLKSVFARDDNDLRL